MRRLRCWTLPVAALEPLAFHSFKLNLTLLPFHQQTLTQSHLFFVNHSRRTYSSTKTTTAAKKPLSSSLTIPIPAEMSINTYVEPQKITVFGAGRFFDYFIISFCIYWLNCF